jgi:hypothetical protein
MKRKFGLKAVFVGLALGFLVLAGCDTGVNPDNSETHDSTDNFKGKKWQSGPSAMNMWNVWDFGNEGTFQFTHYHTAEHIQDNGVYTYRIDDNRLYITPPGEAET